MCGMRFLQNLLRVYARNIPLYMHLNITRISHKSKVCYSLCSYIFCRIVLLVTHFHVCVCIFSYGRQNIDENRSVLFRINVFPLRKRFFNLVNALNHEESILANKYWSKLIHKIDRYSSNWRRLCTLRLLPSN